MATFVPLLGGGYINLDLVLQLLPATAPDGTEVYTALLPGQQGQPLDLPRAAVDPYLALQDIPMPPPAPPKKAKKGG